jgi:2',3'-cyclic-nucleotide 2'-phosphodiesterase
VRILFIGDIVGKPGRRAVQRLLPQIRKDLTPDVVIANGENMTGGAGISRDTAGEMFKLGINALTTGNHVWDQREALQLLEEDVPITRPINYPPGVPGRGLVHLQVNGQQLTVINVQGRVFMRVLDDPFRAMDKALDELAGSRFILVDVHAEATGEKQAIAYYLDGRVSAVVGTHTHVPTADCRVLPKGTAYISDVGMVGPRESIIGNEPGPIIQSNLTQMYQKFEVAGGPVTFNSVVIDLDDSTGLATDIRLLQHEVS